jgi:hypothetical protein
MTPTVNTSLTEHDKYVIARARQLAGLTGIDDLAEYTGYANRDMARAVTLGEAQHFLAELAAIAERLGGDDA